MSGRLYEVASFEAFWPSYVRLHSRRPTQVAHAVATSTAGAILIAAAVLQQPLGIPLAIAADYAIAQASHRAFQRNRTTPWRHPAWHLRAELRMLRLVVTGRMGAEVARLERDRRTAAALARQPENQAAAPS